VKNIIRLFSGTVRSPTSAKLNPQPNHLYTGRSRSRCLAAPFDGVAASLVSVVAVLRWQSVSPLSSNASRAEHCRLPRAVAVLSPCIPVSSLPLQQVPSLALSVLNPDPIQPSRRSAGPHLIAPPKHSRPTPSRASLPSSTRHRSSERHQVSPELAVGALSSPSAVRLGSTTGPSSRSRRPPSRGFSSPPPLRAPCCGSKCQPPSAASTRASPSSPDRHLLRARRAST
jgi:hypothetical protein